MRGASLTDKSHVHRQYYTKRLNTELFRAPTLKDQFYGLTHKIQHEIQMVKRNMKAKHSKMFKAKERRRTMQNEEEQMRNTLRSRIEEKIRLSETNLEKLVLKKSSESKSKQKFRESTLSRIKSRQKTFIDQSFKRAQQHSRKTQTYFNDKKSQRSLSKVTTSSHNSNYRMARQHQTKYQTFYLDSCRKRVFPKVMKISETDIKTRQARKASLEKMKEVRNLSTYVEKLYDIDQKRKTRQGKISETIRLLEKTRIEQRKTFESRKKMQSNMQKQPRKYPIHQLTKGAIRNRVSFSQIYSKKLDENLTRKSFLTQLSIREGDRIIADSSKDKQNKRNSYLLKETLKEMQLKANFRYMQKLKKR